MAYLMTLNMKVKKVNYLIRKIKSGSCFLSVRIQYFIENSDVCQGVVLGLLLLCGKMSLKSLMYIALIPCPSS